ncbi:sensor histidine kinase [Salinifilum ghardaiensis]
MTALGSTALIVAALVLGAVGGIVATSLVHRHRRRASDGPTVAELLQRLVHTSDDGIVILNRFGDVVLHNPRADELGLLRSQQADPRAQRAAEQARETGERVSADLTPPRRGVVSSGRDPASVLGEVRSIGDEFTVIDAADESEAVRLEATRRDFVANVSHELKTPVGGMSVLADAVLDASDDPEAVQHFAEKIRHESNRLGTLVSELISLSRLQGAEALPELTTVDVDAVVDEALERSGIAAGSAGVEVHADQPSGYLLDGDRTLLVTALSNLIDNAISYSPEATPVSVSRRLTEGYVEIAVTDRGIGISPENQGRVFERFFRVDPARSRATGGTGLGLAIVKHVAANHGGEVRLWSQPGTGSTFTLRVPQHGAGAPRSGSGGGVSWETGAQSAAAAQPTAAQPADESDRTDQVTTANTGGVR